MAKTPAANDQPEPNQPQPIVQPTEQLPIEPAPVSARSAASGGATGLANAGISNPGLTSGDEPGARSNTSLFRRHPIASGVVAGAIAVILVAGLTAWGVGTVVAASLTSSTSGMSMGVPTATPTPGASTTAPAPGRQTAGRLVFRATIQSMDGTSWTILTRKGTTLTVTVDSSTQFGTKKVPETASSFAVGDAVIVVATARTTAGTTAGSTTTTTTATATRVINTADVGNGANTTPMPGMTSPPTA
jgi:hypothetical protein